jgi:hypothetical protein
MPSLDRAWRVLCALTAHKPAHGPGHCNTDRGPDFVFATEATQGPLLSVYYTHMKRPPNFRCLFRSGHEDTTKMTAYSMAILPRLPGLVDDFLCVFFLLARA